MHLVSEDIENYCLEKSSKPSKVCEELHDYTKANVAIPEMVIGPLVGSYLGQMVRITRAKRVLEIGTYTGYSALAMAEQLPDDGELITLDMNPDTVKVAKSFWEKSPHGKKIEPILIIFSVLLSY
jgi:caffeoyl-CoA O-methyltransferase